MTPLACVPIGVLKHWSTFLGVEMGQSALWPATQDGPESPASQTGSLVIALPIVMARSLKNPGQWDRENGQTQKTLGTKGSQV